MSDFLDTAQSHPDISSVFSQDDGASMIQMLLLYAPDAFIDYDAAQASFDSPEFLRLLELAKRQTQPEAESPREALLTGQALLEQLMIGRAQYFEEEYEDEKYFKAVSFFDKLDTISGGLELYKTIQSRNSEEL